MSSIQRPENARKPRPEQEHEQMRRARDERYRHLVERAFVGVVQCELDGRFTFANERFRELVGYGADELRRMRMHEMTHPDDVGRSAELVEHLARTGEPFSVETRYLRKDGGVVWAKVSAGPGSVADDKPTSIVAVAVDISERKRSEERERELKERALAATAKFESVFQQSSTFAGITDLDGVVLEANRFSLEACGYGLAQVVGEPFWRTPWWRGSRYVQAKIREATATAAAGEAYVATLPYWRSDGTERLVAFAMHPICDDTGRVVFLHPTGIDVTEREATEARLRASEERLRVATEAAQIGLHDYDLVTGNLAWDSRTRELWGVEPGEPVSYALWRDGLHPDDRQAAEAAVRGALDPAGEGRYHAHYRVVHRQSGVTRWIEVTGRTTFAHGQAVRLVGTVQDITDRKRADQALREADRRKDEFLATLAHELRNPLAGIRMALDVLVKGRGRQTQVEQMQAVIDRQSAQLVRLIDELLDVSRITRGKIELQKQRIDFVEVVRQTLDGARGGCDAKGLQLRLEVPAQPVVLDADPLRVGQVLINLLNNAIKFTPRGGDIEVSALRDKHEVVVRVRDTGLGIPSEQLPHIFEMFAQVEGARGSRDGLGIGLALARSIVDMHGGSIEARSEGLGAGSEFEVRLPALTAQARVTRDEPVGPRPAGLAEASKRILAVDDNADALMSVAVILRMTGHVVETAAHGNEALEKARVQHPEVVVLDIGLPDIDGYEVARRLRAEHWAQEALFIALTGWGQAKDKRRAREAGFDIHMTKPVDADELLRVVRVGEGADLEDGGRARATR
jgi:PAS domain S-box-containing protein